MTKEDWVKAEEKLSLPYAQVKFLIDGYNITIATIPEKPMHYCLAVYIDGVFKTKWCLEDCEERRRFCSVHKKSLLTAEQKKRLKREKKAFREEIENKTTYYTYLPWWNSFRSMKSHFIKNNKSIELAEEEMNNGK